MCVLAFDNTSQPAGMLRLYGVQGIFYTEVLHVKAPTFEEVEAKHFDGNEDFDALADDMESRFYITPLEVNAVTEYVTGSFTDRNMDNGRYRVTVWLLVESPIEETLSYE